MSRWTIEDYSEEELNESQDEYIEFEERIKIDEDDKPHKVPDEITLDYFIPQLDPNNDIKKQDQTSNKQSNINKIRNLLDNILQNINENQIKKSYDEFNELQEVYKQYQKEFKKNGVPHFFIKKIFEINEKINKQPTSNKQARLFQKNIKKFNRNFEKELAEYEEHPENLNDLNEDPLKKSDDDFSISSTDEEQNTDELEISPQDTNNSKEEKFDPNYINDDESIKEVIIKYIHSKSKISMRMDIDYLFAFYQKVVDKKLSRRIQLEICDVVRRLPNWQKIPFQNITKILEFLPELINYAKFLVPVFGRLNQDLLFYSSKLYERQVQNSIHFYKTIHKFVNVLNNFKNFLNTTNLNYM